MTPNEHDDARRLEQIERLMRDGTPSDDPIVNLMRRTVPKPRRYHTQTLEKELFHMDTTQKGYSNNGAEKRKKRPFRFSFALVAVFIVAIIGFGILLVPRGNVNNLTYEAQGDFVLTATYFVEQVTKTAEAMIGVPTATPLQHVPTAKFASGDEMFGLTATQFVAEVTQTFAAAHTATAMMPSPLPTFTLTYTPTPVPSTDMSAQGSILLIPQSQLLGLTDLTTGTRLSIFTKLQNNDPTAGAVTGYMQEHLLTDQAMIVEVMVSEEYAVYVPNEIAPVISWLLGKGAAENAIYLTFERLD
jgi:hypothetical protein